MNYYLDNDIVPNVDVPLRCDDSGHGIRIDADESYEDLLIHASEEDKKTSLAREKVVLGVNNS